MSVRNGGMCLFGHIVGSGNVEPDPGKLEAVREFSVPQTKKQVSFLRTSRLLQTVHPKLFSNGISTN